MRIQPLLLATLGVMPSGCSSVANCHPDERDFDFEADVASDTLDEIVEEFGVDGWDELECDQVCRQVYREVEAWEASSIERCNLELPRDGVTGTVSCGGRAIEYYCEGRRPLGHVEPSAVDGTTLGRVCAEMAHLEAASVVAFMELAEQLGRLGAPESFITRCEHAAEDERHHTHWMATLAAKGHATVPVPQTEMHSGSMLDIALHNAVEGCVYETWAALAAHHRAIHAMDRSLRALFARVAADETRHAQLSWDLHAWFLSQLSAEDGATVIAAQYAALEQLPQVAMNQGQLPAVLGQPTGAQARALASDLAVELAG